MVKVKIGKKPDIPCTTGRTRKRDVAKGVLDRLTSEETATVLWTLLQKYPDLRNEAESVALELVSSPPVEHIAEDVFVAMHRAEGVKSDDLLAWIPDFPAEEACHVVAELIRACPSAKRGAARKRLVEGLGHLVPDWYEMLSQAAKRAAQGK